MGSALRLHLFAADEMVWVGTSGDHLVRFATCVTGTFVCFKAAPYWLDEPQNLILAPGEDGRLVCRANGNPKPAIQWLVNGEPIEGEPGGGVCTSSAETEPSMSQSCRQGARHPWGAARGAGIAEHKPPARLGQGQLNPVWRLGTPCATISFNLGREGKRHDKTRGRVNSNLRLNLTRPLSACPL